VTTATGILCACPSNVVLFGGGAGRFWVAEMKIDPHAPF